VPTVSADIRVFFIQWSTLYQGTPLFCGNLFKKISTTLRGY